MKIRYIITVFVLISFMKFFLSFLIPYPIHLSDERRYLEMGRSFIRTGEFRFEGKLTNVYPPLYPILISITTFFNTGVSFLLIKFINSFLSTSIIFPMYLLSKEFMNDRNSFTISLISVFIPESFVYAYGILTENIYFPLFVFSVYFFYKSILTENKKNQIFSGIFVGLSILARTISFVLLGSMILSLFIYYLLKKRKKISIFKFFMNYFVFFLIILIIIFPWYLVRNIRYFGLPFMNTKNNEELSNEVTENIPVHEVIAKDITILDFSYYILINTSFVLIATGFLFFIFSLYAVLKRRNIDAIKIVLIPIFIMFILACTYWSFTPRTVGTERKLMGRYMTPVFFPILVMGGFGIESYKNNRKDKILFYVFLISSLILLTLPIDIRTGGFDSISTTFLLVPKQAKMLNLVPFLVPDLIIKLIVAMVPLLMFGFRKYFTIDNIAKFMIIFLILNTIVGTIAMRYASLDAEEFMKFAIWMEDNLTDGRVLFDIREDGEEIELFWIIESVRFYTDFSVSEDDYTNYTEDYVYVISKRQLPLRLIRELDAIEGIYEKRELKIFLYENNNK